MEEGYVPMPKNSDDGSLGSMVREVNHTFCEKTLIWRIGRMPMSGIGWERSEDERKVCLVLEKIAAEVGTESVTAGMRFAIESGSYILTMT